VLHPLDRRVEMLLEECFENFHESDSERYSIHKDNIGGRMDCLLQDRRARRSSVPARFYPSLPCDFRI